MTGRGPPGCIKEPGCGYQEGSRVLDLISTCLSMWTNVHGASDLTGEPRFYSQSPSRVLLDVSWEARMETVSARPSSMLNRDFTFLLVSSKVEDDSRAASYDGARWQIPEFWQFFVCGGPMIWQQPQQGTEQHRDASCQYCSKSGCVSSLPSLWALAVKSKAISDRSRQDRSIVSLLFGWLGTALQASATELKLTYIFIAI